MDEEKSKLRAFLTEVLEGSKEPPHPTLLLLMWGQKKKAEVLESLKNQLR